MLCVIMLDSVWLPVLESYNDNLQKKLEKQRENPISYQTNLYAERD